MNGEFKETEIKTDFNLKREITSEVLDEGKVLNTLVFFIGGRTENRIFNEELQTYGLDIKN